MMQDILKEIEQQYDKEKKQLENCCEQQLQVVESLEKEFPNDFKEQLNELKNIREEIKNMNNALSKLDMKEALQDITLSKLVLSDIRRTGRQITNLKNRLLTNIGNLYDNIATKINLGISNTQKKFIETKVNILDHLSKGLENSLIEQQKYLSETLNKINELQNKRDKIEINKNELEDKGVEKIENNQEKIVENKEIIESIENNEKEETIVQNDTVNRTQTDNQNVKEQQKQNNTSIVNQDDNRDSILKEIASLKSDIKELESEIRISREQLKEQKRKIYGLSKNKREKESILGKLESNKHNIKQEKNVVLKDDVKQKGVER